MGICAVPVSTVFWFIGAKPCEIEIGAGAPAFGDSGSDFSGPSPHGEPGSMKQRLTCSFIIFRSQQKGRVLEAGALEEG